MSRKKKKNSNESLLTVREYEIKIPVFVTQIIENTGDELFPITYEDLIKVVKDKVSNFNEPISKVPKNKTKTSVIQSVTYSDIKIGDTPSLLLQVSAYNTNFYDGYLESEEKVQLSKNSKIGNDNNFIIVYPKITGLQHENYTCQYFLFVYEDPNKDNGEVSKIAKIVAKDILQNPVQNIKLKKVLDEISNKGNVPQMEVRYISLQNAEDDEDILYKTYVQNISIREDRKIKYSDIPQDKMIDIITEKRLPWYQRFITFTYGKTEYKITSQASKNDKEYKDELEQLVEKVFNASVAVTQEEIESGKIYDTDFIIEKVFPVISNYLDE